MSRFGTQGWNRLLRGEAAAAGGDVDPSDGKAMLKWLGLGSAVLATCIAAGMAVTMLSLRECVLLAAVAILAVTIGLLLRRHQWFHRTLAAERRHLRTAVDNIPQGLVLYDASAHIVVCNQPYIDMFGLSADVAKQGSSMQRLIAHRAETGSFDGDVEAFCGEIIRNVRLGKATRQITEAPGGRAIEIVNKPLPTGGWVATIEDITPRKRAEEKIAHLAHYDALTDLPNRVMFREEVEHALRELQDGAQLAVLYIDIDEFKSVNDALGHPVGDELLKGVARRLRSCLDEADIAARLGGDEFAVIQNPVREPAGGGFEVHYQPVIGLSDNAITGCEALLRWRHPLRGSISPADFIPVAEDTGLINELGQFVLETACREAAKWPEHVRIAVNVSPVQFRSQTLALNVATALAASNVAPSRLELEITEAVLMRDDEAALATLHQLRALGVKIALDDFGTGYSSLSYLHRFPFDKIKIDRSFVKNIGDEGASPAIIQAVVNIAKASNMTTTAEGVEQEWQRELLRELGCTEMQGYLFSPAVSAAELTRLMAGARDKAASAA